MEVLTVYNNLGIYQTLLRVHTLASKGGKKSTHDVIAI